MHPILSRGSSPIQSMLMSRLLEDQLDWWENQQRNDLDVCLLDTMLLGLSSLVSALALLSLVRH